MGTILYFLFLFVFLLIYYPVFTLIWLVTLPFDPKQKVFQEACRFFAMSIFRCCPLWTIRVSGKEFIDKKKAYVIVSNHQSMFDIPLVFAIPLNFKFVSKKEVYKMPVFGWTLWMRRDVAIVRGGTSSTRQMLYKCREYLRKGVSIFVFPEGTRTKTGRVNDFKEGAFMVAKSAGVAILPVVVDGNFGLVKKNGFGLKMPRTFSVRILEPVPAEEVKRAGIRETAEKVHDRIRSVHRSMNPAYYTENNANEQ